MEQPTPPKSEMTQSQKRLLRLVYVLGGILVVLFFVVMAAILYQVAHLK